jgi:hypothetical protein
MVWGAFLETFDDGFDLQDSTMESWRPGQIGICLFSYREEERNVKARQRPGC